MFDLCRDPLQSVRLEDTERGRGQAGQATLQDLPFVVFKLFIPITVVFMHCFRILNQFGWQPPFPVAHFGWWTLISEDIAAG